MATGNRRMQTIAADDPGVGPGTVVANGLTFNPPGRYIIVSTGGTILGQLVEDTADVAYVLPPGVWPLAFKSCTTVTTLVGCVVR